MSFKKYYSIVVLLVIAIFPFQVVISADGGSRLDEVLLSQDLWTLNSDKLAEKMGGLGFRWVSVTKDSARSVQPGLMLLKQPVLEIIIRFSSNVVSGVMLSLYNRGDAGDIDEAAFQKQIEVLTGEMTGLAGVKGRDITPRQPTRVDRKMLSIMWEKNPSVYVLKYAYSRTKASSGNRSFIRPEFVNLSITKSGSFTQRQLAGEQKVDVGYSELKNHVKKTQEGEVYLDNVPMVDQGQKGYCAVATTERIMRYYGVDVNQHELAQKAATASGGGTDPKSLINALKSMANSLNVRSKTRQEFNVREFMNIVRDYNRTAKKQRTDEILMPMAGVIDVAKIYGEMDKKIFLQMRTRNASQVERFGKIIKDKINNGYPVLWGVQLGIVDEIPKLPQGNGGHLRLIIGYNTKSSEILYSDSWGAGHELKRMKMDAAYAITTGMYTIEPR
ncbi:MAG: C39 family peptidase [Kiritimatiellae bacterium]|nr:C39 family peptidase [Kiritimatiellia bacterium]